MVRLFCCAAVATGLYLFASFFKTPALADEGLSTSPQMSTYAGFMLGAGHSSNEIVDIHGFSNWGHPGSKVKYSDRGLVGGVFAGQRTNFEGTNKRYEVEFMLTDLVSRSNRVDPRPIYGGDETVVTKYDWTLTARFGVDKQIDNVRFFVLGGPALARIENSVTDVDWIREQKRYVYDPDDSFSSESTRFGWNLGIGFEKSIASNWLIRLEGAVFDFGNETYQVNHAANDGCGSGGPKTPCATHKIDHRVSVLRLGFVYQF